MMVNFKAVWYRYFLVILVYFSHFGNQKICFQATSMRLSTKTRDRFYETSFRPKIFRMKFQPQILEKASPNANGYQFVEVL
jgi:hypothetical protein